MPTSSQPSNKVRPYEHIIRQKVKTDQTIQSKNKKEQNKSNVLLKQMDEQHRLNTLQFWKQHSELKNEMSKEKDKMHAIRVASAMVGRKGLTGVGGTDGVDGGGEAGNRRAKRAQSAKVKKSLALAPSPVPVDQLEFQMLSKPQRMLRMQKEANNLVNSRVQKFKDIRNPGESESEEEEFDYYR
ncbi:uncharacterized protein LOC134853250 isoform X2 [Symsagittifera roscoffensis]|uniref:uncharacterized protein LOC134853250 isoform X2 n=1 Tax=Symsagittifera roscoffensis TaxID=84072 RepID=UPI00307BB537